MDKTLEQLYATAILDCFEDLLDEKDIDIPSDDRYGSEDEARIYGCEYYDLEDRVMYLLNKFHDEIRQECVNEVLL